MPCIRLQIYPCLYSYTKLRLKWIKNLHVKSDTLNLIEEKVGKSLQHMDTLKIFLNRTLMAYALSTKINKEDAIKLQSFCKSKDTVNRTKWQPTDWEKTFTNSTSNRELISNIYKELKKLDSRKPNNPLKSVGYRAKHRILN